MTFKCLVYKINERCESIGIWQSQLAGNVAGRKIQNIISALEDVERFKKLIPLCKLNNFIRDQRFIDTDGKNSECNDNV